jgi:pilus assembly protein CpaE
VKNVRLLIDTLALIGGERARREVVLNRADGHAGLQPAEVAEAVRQPLAAVVPADARVPASIDAGKPLMTERVSDDVAAAIRRLTAAITGESTTAKRRGLRLGLKTRMRSR